MSVTFLLGSQSDSGHAEKIGETLKEFGIPYNVIVASAHKAPEKVMTEVQKLNALKTPHVIITIVGLSNGLGGVVAGSCLHPVINCPPFKNEEEYLADIHSSLRMPSYVPVMTVLNPKNAAMATVKILAESDSVLREKVEEFMKKTKEQY